jgi:hypothetical protein
MGHGNMVLNQLAPAQSDPKLSHLPPLALILVELFCMCSDFVLEEKHFASAKE